MTTKKEARIQLTEILTGKPASATPNPDDWDGAANIRYQLIARPSADKVAYETRFFSTKDDTDITLLVAKLMGCKLSKDSHAVVPGYVGGTDFKDMFLDEVGRALSQVSYMPNRERAEDPVTEMLFAEQEAEIKRQQALQEKWESTSVPGAPSSWSAFTNIAQMPCEEFLGLRDVPLDPRKASVEYCEISEAHGARTLKSAAAIRTPLGNLPGQPGYSIAFNGQDSAARDILLVFQGKAVGLVKRLGIKGEDLLWVEPAHRGKGLAAPFLLEAIKARGRDLEARGVTCTGTWGQFRGFLYNAGSYSEAGSRTAVKAHALAVEQQKAIAPERKLRAAGVER